MARRGGGGGEGTRKGRAPRRRGAATEPPGPACPVIGVGASAGGLEALEGLLAAMPARLGAAIVLVPHLSPTGKSMMVELLARTSVLPVEVARDGVRPQPDHVYVVRPNRLLTLRDGHFEEQPRPAPHGTLLPIDIFLRSLADGRGARAAGIVLSGTGSDGTLGLRAIRLAGGLTIAQQEDSARYQDMPHNAIASGVVDEALLVADMPKALADWVGRWAAGAQPAPFGGDIDRVLALLRARSGHDFTHYKRSTISRRIERRMQILRLARIEEYVLLLRERPAELDVLFRDLLIGVTQFFRDPESFSILEKAVLPKLFGGRGADQPIRVWVPACASGEEAYSIAMLLLEQQSAQGSTVPIKVFATDIDEEALTVARAGRYPATIAADVGAERLARFFHDEGGTYRIAKAVRELIVFAAHDLIKDPPFSRLDLISCRNVMIYLDAELQQRLLPLLHGALAADGVLFLGPSETLGALDERFEVIDRKAKLFRQKAPPTRPPRLPLMTVPPAEGFPTGLDAALPVAPEQSLGRATDRILLEYYAPACAVIDARFDVVLFRGRTGRFLEAPSGAPDVNILRMARPGLTRKLRTAVLDAARRQQPVLTRDVRVRTDGAVQRINLTVRPLNGPGLPAGQFLIVVFDEGGGERPGPEAARAAAAGDAESSLVQQLEEELREAREVTQSRVEELETANEELKSANEELLSMNEEQRSTNEELETVREELQSVNEELQSVNAELHEKVAQVTRANSEVQNLLDATQIAVVFLDREGRIRSFTASNMALFNLIPADVGRPLTDIAPQGLYTELAADVAHVLRTLEGRERELRATSGRWFMMRMLPFRTVDNVIDGVVLTFVDVSERKRAETVTEEARHFAEAIVATIRGPLLILDDQLRVRSANAAYGQAFGEDAAAAEGRSLFELAVGAGGGAELRALLDDVMARGVAVDGHALDCDVPRLGQRHLLVNATRLALPASERTYVVLAIEDVTARTP